MENEMSELPEGISQTAADKVRLRFNPSGYNAVDQIKIDAARLITRIEALGKSREASIAITDVESGAMWAVKAATAGAP